MTTLQTTNKPCGNCQTPMTPDNTMFYPTAFCCTACAETQDEWSEIVSTEDHQTELVKVYKPTTSAQDMSIDGWSRGFAIQQTLNEMTAIGIDITIEQIQVHWDVLDAGLSAGGQI